jgi:hypothetical protein
MLQFTSLLFITNAVHAFSRQYIFYAILLVLLTVGSFAWHSSPKLKPDSMKMFWMDQAFIWASIAMSIFYASQMRSPTYKSLLAVFALVALALSIYLIFGTSWDRDYPTEHATLHVIACMCDHFVIAGL